MITTVTDDIVNVLRSVDNLDSDSYKVFNFFMNLKNSTDVNYNYSYILDYKDTVMEMLDEFIYNNNEKEIDMLLVVLNGYLLDDFFSPFAENSKERLENYFEFVIKYNLYFNDFSGRYFTKNKTEDFDKNMKLIDDILDVFKNFIITISDKEFVEDYELEHITDMYVSNCIFDFVTNFEISIIAHSNKVKSYRKIKESIEKYRNKFYEIIELNPENKLNERKKVLKEFINSKYNSDIRYWFHRNTDTSAPHFRYAYEVLDFDTYIEYLTDHMISHSFAVYKLNELKRAKIKNKKQIINAFFEEVSKKYRNFYKFNENFERLLSVYPEFANENPSRFVSLCEKSLDEITSKHNSISECLLSFKDYIDVKSFSEYII